MTTCLRNGIFGLPPLCLRVLFFHFFSGIFFIPFRYFDFSAQHQITTICHSASQPTHKFIKPSVLPHSISKKKNRPSFSAYSLCVSRATSIHSSHAFPSSSINSASFDTSFSRPAQTTTATNTTHRALVPSCLIFIINSWRAILFSRLLQQREAILVRTATVVVSFGARLGWMGCAAVNNKKYMYGLLTQNVGGGCGTHSYS